MPKQPRVTVAEPALEALMGVLEEALVTISRIRYCEWESLGRIRDQAMGTWLKGVKLEASTLDRHLLDGDAVIAKVRRQVKDYKRSAT